MCGGEASNISTNSTFFMKRSINIHAIKPEFGGGGNEKKNQEYKSYHPHSPSPSLLHMLFEPKYIIPGGCQKRSSIDILPLLPYPSIKYVGQKSSWNVPVPPQFTFGFKTRPLKEKLEIFDHTVVTVHFKRIQLCLTSL